MNTNTILNRVISRRGMVSKRTIEFVRNIQVNEMMDSMMELNTLLERKDLVTGVKSYHMAAVDLFHVDGVKRATIEVTKQGENIFLEASEDKTVMVKTSNDKKSYDNFSTDYISVNAPDAVWTEMVGESLFLDLKAGDVLINTNKVKKTKTGDKKAFMNLRTGNLVVADNCKNVIEYKFFISTSGLVKEGSAIFYNANISGSAAEVLNTFIPGIMDCAKEEMSQSDAVKFAARPGLAWTKGLLIAKFDNVAKVEGNFDNALFEGRNRNTADGAILMRATCAMNMFNLKTQADAVGLILQARFFGIYKMQIIVLADEMFESNLANYRANRNVTVYGDENKVDFILDNNAEKAKIDLSHGFLMSLMAIGKLTEGRMSKQMIESLLVAGAMTGRLEEVRTFLIEAATEQIIFEANRVLDTEAKAMKMENNRTSNGSVKSPYSIDVLNSVAPTNPVASKVRLDDSISTMAKMINKMAIKLKNVDGSSQIYNGVVCTDIAAFVGKNIIPKGTIVIGKISKELSRLKAEFGVDSKEYKTFKANHEYATMFKYPKMFFNEFYRGRVLDLEEIAELIDASDFTADEKRQYKFYFNNMADSTIMFPAYREIFELLAGMDIDFDKVVVVFNKFVNETLEGRAENLFISSTVQDTQKVQPTAGSKWFNNAVQKNAKVAKNLLRATQAKVFNPKVEGFFQEVFGLQIKGEGQIGIITHYNNKIIAILIEAIMGNLGQATHFLKECVEATKGEERAYSVDRPVVDPVYVDMMLSEMKLVEWSASNIIAFLIDCSKVFRLYQETSIDAAKTGIYLAVLLTCRTIVIDSLLPVSVEYLETVEEVEEDGTVVETVGAKVPVVVRKKYEEKEVRFFKDINGRMVEYREPMTTMNLNDVMGQVQDVLIDIVNENIREVYNDNRSLFVYSTVEVKDMKDELEAALSTKNGREVANNLYIIKSVYHDVVSKYMEALGNLDADSESYESKAAALKDSHANQIAGIANSARRIIANYSDDKFECGALALAVTVSSKKDYLINPDSKSRFAYNVLPEYALAFLAGGASIEAVGTVLQTGAEVAGEIVLNNGVTANGLVVKERFTGVANFDGKNVTTIVDMFEEVALDDKKRTIIVPAEKNEFIMEDMTRDSIVSTLDGKIFFNADENHDFVAVNNKAIFFDADASQEAEYYVNDSHEIELYLKVKSGGRVVTKRVKCLALSVEIA